MNSVTHALIHSTSYLKSEKLAMQLIPYRSSSAKIEQLRAVFDQFDKNNTGSVSYYEFRRLWHILDSVTPKSRKYLGVLMLTTRVRSTTLVSPQISMY